MKSVGIDIGTSSVKVLEVDQNKKSLVITQFKEFPLGQNPGFDSNIEIIEILRSIAAKYQGEAPQMVVGLRQENVSVRNKLFPFSDRTKILKSLPFELEEDLPFSVDNAIYDAKIIKYVNSSAEVLACTAPKTRISDLLSKMKDAGISASIISCEGIALANCWENWNEEPPSTKEDRTEAQAEGLPPRAIHLVLSVGHSRTLVLAFEGEQLVGVRSIFWGGKDLAAVLMKKYELPFIEALNVLQTKAFILLNQENSSYDQIVFSQSICEGISELARDVQMTMLELQTELNAEVTHVALTGGVSKVKNMHAYLTQVLEVAVNPTSILTKKFELGFQPTASDDSVCGVALGLAIEGLKKPRNPALNFLKNEFQKKNQKLQMLWDDWGDFVKIGAAAFAILFVYAIVRDSTASSLIEASTAALKNQARNIAHLSSKQAGETNIRKFVKDQRSRSLEVKQLENFGKMNSALDILRKISESVPDRSHNGILVTRLLVNDQRVEIEGSVPRQTDLASIQSSLNALSNKGKVDILTPRNHPTSGVPFAYGLSMDRGIVSSTESKGTVIK